MRINDILVNSEKTITRSLTLKRYVWILPVVWTIVIAASLWWNTVMIKQNALESARIQARTAHKKDIIYRSWNAEYGGVYVPVTEETPPNTYLSFIPERDVTTPSGKRLTLMNPAYMTRKVHELAERLFGVRAHITSLNPIRPENVADAWETEALKAFELGSREVSSVAEIEGAAYMRLMRPLLTEKECLKCHEKQGYKEGDIRGGISVSVPMKPIWVISGNHQHNVSVVHALLWLTGIGGIALVTVWLHRIENKRKQAEEQIKNQKILLEQAVQEKQNEMEVLMDRLIRQERLAAIGQISGSIAHELRNPLGVIKQSIFYLNRLHKNDKLASSNSKVQDHLKLLSTEIDASDRVITDLLQMSKLKPLKKELANLQAIISEAVEKCHIEEGIQMKTDLNPEPFLVRVDPMQMRQVLINVLSNAVQAISQKGLVKISAKMLNNDEKYLIEIQDNGCGIVTKNLNKAFEPLFTTKSKGTGLGLSICKQIIENHGGSITLSSQINEGTTVIIELPFGNNI